MVYQSNEMSVSPKQLLTNEEEMKTSKQKDWKQVTSLHF
jgi:hypothetical protein